MPMRCPPGFDDIGRIEAGYPRSAGEFVARLGLEPGERVLDVSCGSGNVALAAARAGAAVTGIDADAVLLARAARETAAEGLAIAFDAGHADQLPYADGSFDTVVTMFGAMFTARPECAARELLRVTRSGGRIAMANWTPAGFIGQMLERAWGYAPAAADIPSPLLWGTEDAVRARLGGGWASLSFTHRLLTFEYPFAPEEVVNEFRLWHGPTLRAFEALEAEAREALRRELEALWADHNRATDGTTRVQSEYLEVLAVVR